MNSYSRYLPPILIFVVSFVLMFMLTNYLRDAATAKYQEMDKEEIGIIHEEIIDQFRMFIDASLMIGQVSSQYLGEQQDDPNYGRLVKGVLQDKEYVIGLNRVATDGTITATYPDNLNLPAKGKKTQFFQELRTSLERKELYWFSPPFELYQGGYGFTFYVPIYSGDKHQGWIAPVINSQRFFDYFRKRPFFSAFDLVIKDEATERDYFSTGIEPKGAMIHETKRLIKGRNLIIQSWRKEDKQALIYPWYRNIFYSSILPVLLVLWYKQYRRRKEIQQQLENVSTLLQITAKEALSVLVEIHSQFSSLTSRDPSAAVTIERDFGSLSNLIEQIDLLQTMSESEEVHEERFLLLPLLKELVAEMEDITLRKDLLVILNEVGFEKEEVFGNRAFLKNSALKYSFTHCVLFSRPGSKVSISLVNNPESYSLKFYTHDLHATTGNEALILGRRLSVVKNAMRMLGGDLDLEKDEGNGMIVSLNFSRKR